MKKLFITMICIFILPSLFFKDGGEILAFPTQEKAYLHTDKSFYLIGDTIWLKGYLVDAQTHKESDAQSRFLYIELINRKNKVIQRKKIKEENGHFSNFIPLEKDIEEADYQIRANTNFMRNQGEEFFFTKQIPVYANTSSLLTANIEYDSDETDGKYAVITLLRKDGTLYAGSRVEYMIRTKEYMNRFRRVRTNADGQIRFKLPDREKGVEPYVYLSLYEKEYVHRKRIFLPQDYEYTVGFYPEGGHLLAGVQQQVAFKAETSTGEIINVEGYVLNQRKDTLVTLNSEYAGIGSFTVQADEADTLCAFVKDNLGHERSFTLPKASTTHISLAIHQDPTSVHYCILTPLDRELNEDFGLLVHTRGKSLLNRVVSREQLSDSIPLDSFPEGIAHFTLFNRDTTVVSERLVFVRKPDAVFQLAVSGTPADSRQPVKMGLRILDNQHRPVQGNFSLSITDDFAVNMDATTNHVVSELLLNSDLKGNVFSPAYYFSSCTPTIEKHLNQLMLTHGWRRYDVSTNLREAKYKYEVEKTQQICGYVESHFDKKRLSHFALLVSTSQKAFKQIVVSNEKGEFSFTHNFQQVKDRLTEFLINGAGKKPKWRYGIYMNETEYPSTHHLHWQKEEIPLKSRAFIKSVREDYTLVNGEKIYRLPEVEVTALQLPDGWVSYKVVEPEKIEQINEKTALDLLKRTPNIMVHSGVRNSVNQMFVLVPNRNFNEKSSYSKISGSNGESPISGYWERFWKRVPVIVDGYELKNLQDLENLRAEDVKSINFVRDKAMYIANSEDHYTWENYEETEAVTIANAPRTGDALPLIVQPQKVYISTYLSKGIIGSSIPSIARIGYLSYAENAEFYAPQYPTEESRKIIDSDKRTTIHWEPNIRLNEKGETGLSFYTADRPSTYTIVIEGITDDGRVCRYVKQIK